MPDSRHKRSKIKTGPIDLASAEISLLPERIIIVVSENRERERIRVSNLHEGNRQIFKGQVRVYPQKFSGLDRNRRNRTGDARAFVRNPGYGGSQKRNQRLSRLMVPGLLSVVAPLTFGGARDREYHAIRIAFAGNVSHSMATRRSVFSCGPCSALVKQRQDGRSISQGCHHNIGSGCVPPGASRLTVRAGCRPCRYFK